MTYTRTSSFRWMVLIGCIPVLAACGESGTAEPRFRNLVFCENPGVAAPSCPPSIEGGYSLADDSALRTKLEGCAVAGCHGDAASTFSINMAASSVEAALSPLTATRATNGDYLVDDFDPDCSNMLTKVTDEPASGLQMPVGGPFWSADEIACFRSYLHEMSN